MNRDKNEEILGACLPSSPSRLQNQISIFHSVIFITLLATKKSRVFMICAMSNTIQASSKI